MHFTVSALAAIAHRELPPLVTADDPAPPLLLLLVVEMLLPAVVTAEVG